MARKLKVWGGCTIVRHGIQERAVVAAYSQKQVAEITGETLYYIRGWWCITGNKADIEQAMQKPLCLVFPNRKEQQ